jgi:hypothetical protein
MEEEKVELSLHEQIENKENEMKEKYADVINDLAVKYGKTLDIGFDMLCAIPRAVDHQLIPDYSTDIEYDKAELMKDWKELEALSEQTL